MTYFSGPGSLIFRRKVGGILHLIGTLVKEAFERAESRREIGLTAHWIMKTWLPRGQRESWQEEASMAWRKQRDGNL